MALHTTCDGVRRRDFLRVGALGTSSVTLANWLRWTEAADLIVKGVANTIAAKELTYDLARLREAIRASKRELAARRNVEEAIQQLIPGAKLMSCSGFGDAIIRHMDD